MRIAEPHIVEPDEEIVCERQKCEKHGKPLQVGDHYVTITWTKVEVLCVDCFTPFLQFFDYPSYADWLKAIS